MIIIWALIQYCEDYARLVWDLISGINIYGPLHKWNILWNTLREYRDARLWFAQEYVQCTDEDWSRVMFSEESRFFLDAHDRRRSMYRRPGERFKQSCFEEKDLFSGGSIMVWAGITSGSRIQLYIMSMLALFSEYGRRFQTAHLVNDYL